MRCRCVPREFSFTSLLPVWFHLEASESHGLREKFDVDAALKDVDNADSGAGRRARWPTALGSRCLPLKLRSTNVTCTSLAPPPSSKMQWGLPFSHPRLHLQGLERLGRRDRAGSYDGPFCTMEGGTQYRQRPSLTLPGPLRAGPLAHSRSRILQLHSKIQWLGSSTRRFRLPTQLSPPRLPNKMGTRPSRAETTASCALCATPPSARLPLYSSQRTARLFASCYAACRASLTPPRRASLPRLWLTTPRPSPLSPPP